jgi:hypothetical protein
MPTPQDDGSLMALCADKNCADKKDPARAGSAETLVAVKSVQKAKQVKADDDEKRNACQP